MSKTERLECTVKNYAWGKLGEESEVARLFAAGHEQAKIGQNTPYAELWIGTHPDGPAKVRSREVILSEHIAEGIGHGHNMHLPYIMKIMSINHTLSLQVHPTKEQALALNRKDPLNYPDQNHKPELAYALSTFELLCGFRPMEEIVQNLRAFPELCQAMGTANSLHFIGSSKLHHAESQQMIQALKKCFTNLMNFEKENVHELLAAIFKRIRNGVRGILTEGTIEVMRDMFKRFPNDIGCLSPLFLNHIILEPGECVFYEAQELHAYLSGECVECVSCSNNTIRAGLTSKFVDRENLVELLNYRMVEPSFYYVHPQRLKLHPNVLEYDPHCEDFTLHRLEIDGLEDGAPVDLPALGCPSTFVLVQGDEAICMELGQNGQVLREQFNVKRGDIFYIPPMNILRFVTAKGQLKAFRTFSYGAGPDHSKRNVAKSLKLEEKAASKLKSMAIYDIETEMDGFL